MSKYSAYNEKIKQRRIIANKMHNAGNSIEEIAQKLGIKYESVIYYINQEKNYKPHIDIAGNNVDEYLKFMNDCNI